MAFVEPTSPASPYATGLRCPVCGAVYAGQPRDGLPSCGHSWRGYQKVTLGVVVPSDAPVLGSVDPNPVKVTGLPRSLTFYGSQFDPAQATVKVTQGTLGAVNQGSSTAQRLVAPATTLSTGAGEAWVEQGGKSSAKVPFTVNP